MAAAPHGPSRRTAMRETAERDSGSREETGPVRSSRESLRASAATHTQREREREVNGSTPPRGMAAASHVPSLLSAMRVHTERDSGSREETGPVRSSRESLRASAATHTQRERERERGEWQHASSWDGSRITCLLSPLCHAREHRESHWEERGHGTGTEQQREPAGLCSHTHAEREREREVNGSTPPRGMAAASHVSSLLSAMRVHTESDRGCRSEAGPVRSSRESAQARAHTHT